LKCAWGKFTLGTVIRNPVNITVVAAAQNGSYIAKDDDGSYYVITLDDTRDIDCGDVLAGKFDGRGSLFYAVRSVTKKEDVRICLETWESPLGPAIKMLLNFMSSGSGKIWVGARQFQSNAPGVSGRLHEAILRAE
jgi:hypothetical protein